MRKREKDCSKYDEFYGFKFGINYRNGCLIVFLDIEVSV